MATKISSLKLNKIYPMCRHLAAHIAGRIPILRILLFAFWICKIRQAGKEIIPSHMPRLRGRAYRPALLVKKAYPANIKAHLEISFEVVSMASIVS